MPFSDEIIEELFQLLDRLGSLGEEELLRSFTNGNIEAMRAMAGQLQEGMDLERVLSEKRFVAVVQDLFQARRTWSRRLDETLVNAALEFDRGNRIQALWIINGYIRFCPSPYYRRIAEGVMEGYEKE